MSKKMLYSLMVVFVTAATVLSACGQAATQAPAATEASNGCIGKRVIWIFCIDDQNLRCKISK